MTAKIFETQFKIGAAWTGAAGIQKAQNALTRLGKHAQATANRMRATMTATAAGVFGGQAIFSAATRAIHAVGDAHSKAVEAAAEAQKVEDHLGLTLQKNAKRWGLNEKQVKLQQQAIIAMGDSLAKLGLDGETAIAMFDEVSQAVDPRALANYKKGLADLLISQKGVNASEEDAIALGKDVAKVIEFKMPKALKAFKGVTEEQIEAYSKLETREERQAWFMQNIAKETGALEAAMDTAEGKIVKRANMIEDLQESWGKPWLVLRQAVGEGLASMVEQIQPHMDRLSEELGPRLKAIGEEFKAFAKSPEVVVWFDRLGTAVKFVTDHWKELSIAVAAVAGFAAVGAVLGTVAFAVSALISPIGLVVVACAALVAAGAAIYANWDTIAAKAQEVWGTISAAWTAGIEALKTGDLSTAFESWRAIPETIWTTVLQPIIDYAWKMTEGIRTAVGNIYSIITAPFLQAYNDITGWFSTLPSKIWGGLQGGPTGVSEQTGAGWLWTKQHRHRRLRADNRILERRNKQVRTRCTDKWTKRGYSATGQESNHGVVAVNERPQDWHHLRRPNTGKHYIAADGTVTPTRTWSTSIGIRMVTRMPRNRDLKASAICRR